MIDEDRETNVLVIDKMHILVKARPTAEELRAISQAREKELIAQLVTGMEGSNENIVERCMALDVVPFSALISHLKDIALGDTEEAMDCTGDQTPSAS